MAWFVYQRPGERYLGAFSLRESFGPTVGDLGQLEPNEQSLDTWLEFAP